MSFPSDRSSPSVQVDGVAALDFLSVLTLAKRSVVSFCSSRWRCCFSLIIMSGWACADVVGKIRFEGVACGL